MSQSELNDYQDSGRGDYKDSEVLRNLYHGEKLSMPQIAEKLNVGSTTVESWMNKHGIERRSISQAKTVQHGIGKVSLNMNVDGYYRWEVQYENEKDTVPVHRLLAISEYGFEEVAGNEVHHKNGIPWMNTPENITVMSKEEHLSIHKRGEDNPFSKLTREEVDEIRERISFGECSDRLAKEFGVTEQTIRDIHARRTWVE